MTYKKILIIRTDRIGDVVVSTPVIKAVREELPDAYIAMMVRPYAKDVISGNPFLDDVIIYDKYGAHKSILATLRFALKLRRQKFDLALILHPTNRAHWITFLAGINKRIGWGSKCGFLLTKRLPFIKHEGKKHESDYTMDVARVVGIDGNTKDPFVPIREDAKNVIDSFLKRKDINENDMLIGVHPGASCPSKRWPSERFAKVADDLIEKLNCKVVIFLGPGEIELARGVQESMKHPAIIADNNFSIAQMAALIKKCRFFITNDNGPMHIASAVGTPVVAIFGRSQAGLSPRRWGPLGEKDVFLHKSVGCKVCLAHNCKIGFKCLLAISVEEVLTEAARHGKISV